MQLCQIHFYQKNRTQKSRPCKCSFRVSSCCGPRTPYYLQGPTTVTCIGVVSFLEQSFSTFLVDWNPNETFRGSGNPRALIYLSCTIHLLAVPQISASLAVISKTKTKTGFQSRKPPISAGVEMISKKNVLQPENHNTISHISKHKLVR